MTSRRPAQGDWIGLASADLSPAMRQHCATAELPL
jgi:hypothetical protein